MLISQQQFAVHDKYSAYESEFEHKPPALFEKK